jgi:hypothetical protein
VPTKPASTNRATTSVFFIDTIIGTKAPAG